MSITMYAYMNFDFVSDAIDLLCAGVSWHGGKFSSARSTSKDKDFPNLSEQDLAQIAKGMLLEGRSLVKVDSINGKIIARQIGNTQEAEGNTVISIERRESDLFPGGEPILERVGSSIQLYEKALEDLPSNPTLAGPLNNALSMIHSVLGVPRAMVNQTRFSQLPVEVLMDGALHYQSEVESLRWNILAGLNEAGFHIAGLMDLQAVVWDWNENWMISAPCNYGHVYQVFLSKGIALDPIRDSELGGMKQALQAGLISNKAYTECAASYGIR